MTRLQRLTTNWVYGALPISWLLLGLLFLFREHLSLLQFLLALHLPVYMWHQYEEHDDNKFKRYIDKAWGENILTQNTVFIINVLGVWVLFTFLIILSLTQSAGLGVGVVFLTGLNGITHLLAFIKTRKYNPGLLTALALFFPLAIGTLKVMCRGGSVSPLSILLGIAIGVGVHLVIIIHARRRKEMLRHVR